MQFRKPHTNTDDTLVFDKSMDVVLQCRENPKLKDTVAENQKEEEGS